MIERICPKCGTPFYSSDTSNTIWICQECESEIYKSEEKEIEYMDIWRNEKGEITHG